MPEHLLFLTGRLARARLEKVLESMQPTEFSYSIRDVGVKVAALMTARMIRRRVVAPVAADRIMLPGRCRGDLEELASHYGVPVVRGPEDVKDLPEHFGGRARATDLSRHEVRIFAEIVDAPAMDVPAILDRARADGADVVDLGCLPDTPFPHLEEAVRALLAEGVAGASTRRTRRSSAAGPAPAPGSSSAWTRTRSGWPTRSPPRRC